jgi:hypothetical protein
VIATDGDREGEVIGRELLDYFDIFYPYSYFLILIFIFIIFYLLLALHTPYIVFQG